VARSGALARRHCRDDDLALHKSPEIRKAIEAEGAGRRFLPRYSPGFNPIDPSGALSNH
jgi:transposase